MRNPKLLTVLTALSLLSGLADTVGSWTDASGPDPLSLPEPVTDADYHDDGAPSRAKVELGRLLFFDKLLSGNRNISCATCHHPELASADALALPIGEGGRGLGTERRSGVTLRDAVYERVPRNSPALFNLGAREYSRMFHDGRVELDPEGNYESGFVSPAKWKLPTGLENLLAAQAMFPVTSPTEMAGQQGENEIADAKAANKAAGPEGVWSRLARRLRDVPEYVDLFAEAFPDQVRDAEDVSFVLAANAIAAFENVAFRADDSPFDRYLRGEADLPADARRGMELFYGRARCADCHSGKFQTDHEFHAIAMPQIGPGKSDGWDDGFWRATGVKAFPEDFGRGRVTVRGEDRYRFRTPSLRNVELTAPYGHAGTYATLEEAVRHHADPVGALERYEVPDDLLVPIPALLELVATGSTLESRWLTGRRLEAQHVRDTWVQSSPTLRARIATTNELPPIELSDGDVDDLVAFLRSLTDPASRDLSHLVPARVPSGLPVED